MKTARWMMMMACLAVGLSAAADEAMTAIGKAAPDFSLTDTNGKMMALAQFKGKTVVLEWTNYNCPFVKKFYNAGAMQKLQKTYTDKGVIWLSINSSAPGKEGNFPADKWNEMIKEKNAVPTAVLLDPDGIVGKLYGAKTTPHLFIINPEGILVYMGAIDDKPSFKPEDLEGAKNYVTMALDAVLAGKPVEIPSTKSYGCGVKY